MRNYQYAKMHISDVRAHESIMQFSDIRFVDESCNFFQYANDAECICDNVPENPPWYGHEGPDKLIDNSTDTKLCYLDSNYSVTNIIINFGSTPLDIDVYTKWQWYTANDSYERDPISFEFYISEDGITYYLVSEEVDYDVTTDRYSLAYEGDIQAPEPPGPEPPGPTPTPTPSYEDCINNLFEASRGKEVKKALVDILNAANDRASDADTLDFHGAGYFVKNEDFNELCKIVSWIKKNMNGLNGEYLTTDGGIHRTVYEGSFVPWENIHVLSSPHLIDKTLPLTKLDIDLSKAVKQVTVGTKKKETLTEIYKDKTKEYVK